MSSLFLLAQAANGSSGGGGALLAGGAFLIIVWVLLILASIFWIWMLIDCLTSSLPATEKIIWLLVILFTHLIGALIYFFIGRSRRSIST